MSKEKIIAALEHRMMNVPKDSSPAQGEALNLGMFEITSNVAKVQAARDEGLFETGRDVIVIAVTDEQDVCFDYAKSSPRVEPVHKLYTVKGKQVEMPDPIEARFFNETCVPFLNKHRDGYFETKIDPNHALDSHDVAEAFKTLQSKIKAKVIMQAIVNTTVQPPLAHDERDAEKAYGILELVTEMGSGIPVDLNKVDKSNSSVAFWKELGQLGESANYELSFATGFDCVTDGIHADAIDTDGPDFELQIVDRGQPIARYSPACVKGFCQSNADGAMSWKREGQGAKRRLRAYVSDPKKFGEMMHGQNVKEPVARIVFKTRPDVNTKTGLKNTGKKVDGPTQHGPIPSATTPRQPAPINLPAPAKSVSAASATKSAATKSAATKSAATKSAATKPATTKPADKTPAATKAAVKPAAKTEAKAPVTNAKPAAKAAAAAKPAVQGAAATDAKTSVKTETKTVGKTPSKSAKPAAAKAAVDAKPVEEVVTVK